MGTNVSAPDPDYVYRLIKDAGLTVRTAAPLVGIRNDNLHQIVKGKRACPPDVLHRLEALARARAGECASVPDAEKK